MKENSPGKEGRGKKEKSLVMEEKNLS